MAKDYCSINFAGLTHDHSLRRPGDDLDDGEDYDGLCSAIAILKRHPMYDCLLLVKKYRNCLGGHSLEFPIDRVRDVEREPTNESAHHPHHQQHHHNQPHPHQQQQQQEDKTPETAPSLSQRSKCARQRLVTRFLDGDDPMHRAAFLALRNNSSMSLASDQSTGSSQPAGGQHQPHLEESNNSTSQTSESPTAAEAQQQQQQQQQQQHLPEEFQLFMNQLDDRGDQCSLVHVPINGLLDRLESYTRNGVAVDGRVYAFAMGLKTAERMMTTKSMKELQETPI